MDPLQLTGIVAISVGAGFVASSHRYSRLMRRMQSDFFQRALDSTTRFAHAALQTMTEDFKIDELQARSKLFLRCGEHGMQMVEINTKTGQHVNLSTPKGPKK